MPSALPRQILHLIPFVLGAAVLIALGRTFGLHGIGQAFAQLQPSYLALYGALAALVFVAYTARWVMVSRAAGADAPLRQFMAARLAGDALGSLLPGGRIGGDPYRVALLYSRGAGGVATTAGVAVDRILEITGNSMAAISYVIIYSVARAAHLSLALLVALMLLLGATLATVVALWRARRPFSPLLRSLLPDTPRLRRVIETMRRIEDQLAQFFRSHPAAFLIGLAISVLIELTTVVEYHFLFSAFGLELDVPTILMILLGGGVARAIPMPAALGALEASEVTVLALTSGRPDLGFVVGLVLRLHETLWLLLGLTVVSAYGLTPRRLRATAAEPVVS